MRLCAWKIRFALIAIAMTGCLFALSAQDQPKQKPLQKMHDLSGIWLKAKQSGFGFPAVGEEPVMLPAAQKIYSVIRASQSNARLGGADALNPNIYPYCLP